MKEPIESKVARTILQDDRLIAIGKRVYKVSPPSTATLIRVSESISRLPQVRLDKDHIVEDSLYVARECRVLGDVLAWLILGEKRGGSTFLRRFRRRRLARYILRDISPSELQKLIADLLNDMEIGDFFGLTTFLTGINLIRPTRKVETSTTASGQ